MSNIPNSLRFFLLLASVQTALAGAPWYQEDFEKSDTLPPGWEKQGDIVITGDEKFQGNRALRMARTEEKFDVATGVTSPPVKISPGMVEVGGAFKALLHSPDSSFNATVLLQCLDAAGHVIDSPQAGQFYGTVNWTQIKKQVTVPPGTMSARLRIELNKTWGSVWIDNLSLEATSVSVSARGSIGRILLKTAAPGNMLLPGDKPVFDATVESAAPLPAGKPRMAMVVRDYWGAEQGAPVAATLGGPETNGAGVLEYKAKIDLSGIPLETGKLYEVDASVDGGPGNQARESSSFVILPEAATKKYPWKEIPFSSRDWDNRIPEYFTLSDRLGIRTLGVWGGWSAKPPYTPTAPGFAACVKFDAGVLASTPIGAIEHRPIGPVPYTEAALREGIHDFFKAYGKGDRLVFVLGNEPPTTPEIAARNVPLYKLMYEEIKKISPGTFVVSTSVGPAEEYFKLGFQNYCDAVDFHTYEDSDGVNVIFKKYAAMFEKYGGKKPIWSTESGLNSQGLTRRAIATDLIKKFSLFFANGGQTISWFDICYPDRLGKGKGGSSDSFNVFDGLYGLYSPRLDAVAYYNMVNAICVKKFAGKQVYEDGIQSCSFADKDGHNLLVLWKNRGARDVFVPLEGIGAVQMIRIDGVLASMDANKKGISLRVGEDPTLLLYDGKPPEVRKTPELDPAPISITSMPEKITRGEPATLNLSLKGIGAEHVKVTAPPFWKVGEVKMTGDSSASVVIDSPPDTEARYAPITVSLAGAGGGDGNLPVFIPVQGQLSAQILPVPVSADSKPAVELLLHNNNSTPETAQWKLSLPAEIPLKAGRYTMEAAQPAQAYFGGVAEGSSKIEAHADARIRVPLEGTDPFTPYKVAATVTDALGRVISCERLVGGFVSVPKLKGTLKMDGSLDEADWARCIPQKIDEERQYRHILKTPHVWAGPKDLSGELRFLWDDKYLYVGIKVTDDVFRNEAVDGNLWSGDGIQILVDPARALPEKPGKYDYGFALTKKGPQAWCFLSADGRAPAGETKDILVAAKRLNDGTGSINYEIAIPWNRVLPFHPEVGADLGLAMALNEDDGAGRDGFMAWFGDIQSKEISPAGDLILGE